jgi:peptidyl-prolyl cis-trans isomerase D
MLAVFRRSLNTWPARLLFLVLVAAFTVWGVGDVIRNGWNPSWLAKVGDTTISLPEFQTAYQARLTQVTRMMGNQGEPDAETRRAVAEQALQRLISQAALTDAANALRLVVPDDALRQAVFAMPAFKGADGKFDKQRLDAILQNNNLTETRFLELMRTDIAQQQLLGPIRAGAFAPEVLRQAVFAFRNEKRVASMVTVPFDSVPAPPPPAEAVLKRWYDNHPDLYSSPEYRRIKAVILSAETLAKDITIPDSAVQAAYDQRRKQFVTPEKRSVQVVLLQGEAAAKALAAQWQAGASWADIQATAQKEGGAPVELNDAAATEFPVAELAKSVFATPDGQVGAPVHSPLGWHVFKVTKVTPGTEQTFAQVKDALRHQLALEQASQQLYADSNKVEDALAGGATLSELPTGLGLAAVTGTLDKQGDTEAGQPAPIPGPPELRTAIVAAAFQAKVGDPPQLTPVQTADGGQAYYAVSVEKITPAALKPYDKVAAEVLADWTRDAQQHAANERATHLLVAVQAGQTLADAATIDNLQVTTSPPIGRQGPVTGVPAELLRPLFTLKLHEPTMVETPDSFVIAVLDSIQDPDPSTDPAGYSQLGTELTGSIANDLELTLVGALRARAKPRVNRTLFESVVQP